MSELDEMKEEIEKPLTRFYAWIATRDGYTDDELSKQVNKTINKILKAQTKTCRIVVVRKEGELQAAIDMVPFGMQAQDAYCEAQCDMLKAGYVQEVKDA